MAKRTILHCDCNSFFASVETVLNPALRDVPMAVCGDPEDRHGIVLAKNELAKRYGICTAETVYSARRKCPSLVIASPHHGAYQEFSRRVNDIYARYTDQIEPFGIDESWLDVTASYRLFGDGVAIAERIRREVREEIGITVSIGVSFNKVFAKLGSDYRKPDAITVISEDNFRSLVYPLPVGALLFVGQRTEAVLQGMGVRTVGELSAVREELLVRRLGKSGALLSRYARGLDDSPVTPPESENKSISNGFTFRHDLVGREACRTGLLYLCEEIAARLRQQGVKCGTLALTIKDTYLATIQRQRPMPHPSDVARELAQVAYEILIDEWSDERPVRMLTVTATGLLHADEVVEQLDIFSPPNDESEKKTQKRENAVDIIRQKYGNDAIVPGAVIGTDIGIYQKKRAAGARHHGGGDSIASSDGSETPTMNGKDK